MTALVFATVAGDLSDTTRGFIGGVICGLLGTSLIWYISMLIIVGRKWR